MEASGQHGDCRFKGSNAIRVVSFGFAVNL